ncbi:DUF3168 domain-containing protein [Ensifer sp. T173]|uniref:DUF3168 domain-containing protein n=1 Tax=Ensifer canadensis TaxID=555315 RepID=A0AAW4FE07_9HYPH|nr:DUF3168 domain-containing protein [Ensifer canadensis]MBM3089256.1 DUF3168 domain-containing protein [Ensifer canadensis]UBI76820.1 DUF3168 domain-containing protein [Ensifer canadensis]
MIEPTVALRTAIRAALIASPEVSALVPAAHIRAGSTRPDNFPMIIMSDGQTEFLGNASGSQYVARVFLDLHIWSVDDGADTAKAIGFAVCNALKEVPAASGFAIDEFSLPAVHWMRDPDPALSYAHGVINVEAVIRWSI